MAAVTGEDVADFLGAGDDTSLVALAGEHVAIMTTLARSYTRGRGFAGTDPAEDIAAVITTATARLAANPEQLASDFGSVSLRGGWQGWNLAEQIVLNRYRGRAQLSAATRSSSTSATRTATISAAPNYGVVVTEQHAGTFDPFNVVNYYYLILPRSLDRSGGNIKSVNFGTNVSTGLATPIVPILDGRGPRHHYEATVSRADA